VLAGENALAGAALLRAGILLGDGAVEASGRAALELVLERSYARGLGVNHVVEPGPERLRFLESQADVAFGFLDAFETTGDPRYLAAGKDVADFALNNLLVSGERMLRDRLPERRSIGALQSPRHPSGSNARLARALLRLVAHGQDVSYREKAADPARTPGTWPRRVAGVEPALAIEELVQSPIVVRIEGAPADALALRRAALELARPWVVITTAPDGGEGAPSAVVSWKGRSATVDRADRLAPEVERMLAERAGRSR
jgi:uncharacterized protein YyaL (SSP411 family)